jgi:hypothetical protein
MPRAGVMNGPVGIQLAKECHELVESLYPTRIIFIRPENSVNAVWLPQIVID